MQSKELQRRWPCRLSPTILHRVEATATLDAPSADSLWEECLKFKKKKEKKRGKRGSRNEGRQTKIMTDFNSKKKEENRNGEDGEFSAKGILGTTSCGVSLQPAAK